MRNIIAALVDLMRIKKRYALALPQSRKRIFNHVAVNFSIEALLKQNRWKVE